MQTSSVGGSEPELPWWRSAVGYQIYLRSFSDSDGDGIGDLGGVISRLDHLAWLGVDLIWITPFYPTPDRDHGYDVSDYCGVDPRFGDLDTVDRLLAAARERGIRVFVDLVPNHSSSDHRWFRAALTDPTGPWRDYFVWRDPAPDGGPPNNWVSYFGGPAWTLDPASGQYYLHLFLPEQPDLNWASEAVRAEFDAILRFWCERGVDGFRIDVCQGIMKHPDFPNNPQRRPITPDMGPMVIFDSYEHRYDLGQPASADVFRRWHDVVEPYGATLLGELGVWDPALFALFVGNGALDVAFALEPGLTPWDPPGHQLDLVLGMRDAAGPHVAWELTNHDQRRAPSRFGGGATGLRRTFALLSFMFCLDGLPFLYQGDELGLEDGEIAPGHLADPISTRNPGTTDGRDASRTPMPWRGGPSEGFTTASSAWLPSRPRRIEETVEYQRATPGTPLHHVRALVGLRKNPALWRDPIVSCEREGLVTRLRRPHGYTVSNLSELDAPVGLPPGKWRVAFRSWPVSGPEAAESTTIPDTVPPETTIVFVEQPGA